MYSACRLHADTKSLTQNNKGNLYIHLPPCLRTEKSWAVHQRNDARSGVPWKVQHHKTASVKGAVSGMPATTTPFDELLCCGIGPVATCLLRDIPHLSSLSQGRRATGSMAVCNFALVAAWLSLHFIDTIGQLQVQANSHCRKWLTDAHAR